MTIRTNWSLLLGALVGFGVLGYNLWAYSCGLCTLRSLGTLGPAGYLLLGINLGLFGLLQILKLRQQRLDRRQRCRCGRQRLPAWRYCPDCGEACQP